MEEELEVRKGTLAFPEDELRNSLHRSIEEWYVQLRACLVHSELSQIGQRRSLKPWPLL